METDYDNVGAVINYGYLRCCLCMQAHRAKRQASGLGCAAVRGEDLSLPPLDPSVGTVDWGGDTADSWPTWAVESEHYGSPRAQPSGFGESVSGPGSGRSCGTSHADVDSAQLRGDEGRPLELNQL